MIEMDDIVHIGSFPDGHTAFWTKDGTTYCSCGATMEDKDYVYPDTV